MYLRFYLNSPLQCLVSFSVIHCMLVSAQARSENLHSRFPQAICYAYIP